MPRVRITTTADCGKDYRIGGLTLQPGSAHDVFMDPGTLAQLRRFCAGSFGAPIKSIEEIVPTVEVEHEESPE